MLPQNNVHQKQLFDMPLEQLLNPEHGLYRMANRIAWHEFDRTFAHLYSAHKGRTAKPIRLLVGLHYLKQMYEISDDEVVKRWVENPYWQYFCGARYFQHTQPLDASLLSKWRVKIRREGLQKLSRWVNTIHRQPGRPRKGKAIPAAPVSTDSS